MHFSKLFLIFLPLAALSNEDGTKTLTNENPNVWNFQIARKIIASFQYKGMGMSIWEDQGFENTTITSKRQFYVTPVTEFLPNSSLCEFNDFTETFFITFSIQFWNDRLQLAAMDRLKQMQIDVIQEQVQPLPFYQVRVIWNSVQEKLLKATLSNTWNNNLQQQSVHQFKLLTDDRETCERLADVMITKPDLFAGLIAVEYSLSAANTATRTIVVTVNHFMNSKLMAALKTMDVQGQDRYMTADDANRLTLEILDNIIATQVIDGDYVPDSDQITLRNIVTNAMQFKEISTGNFTEKMWESVYWDPTYARPDEITSYLNRVLKIDQGNHTVTKSNQYSDKGDGGIDFGIGDLFKFGGKGSGESSSSATFSELYEWLRQNNYEVDIKGNIFIPKSLNLQRLNLDVLSREETIFTKSVQMHHVDAPGLLKVTVGQKSCVESEDIKRLRQNTNLALDKISKLEPRTGRLETRLNIVEPALNNTTTKENQLESNLAAIGTTLAHRISGCRVCFQEIEGSGGQCGGARNTCSGWSHQGVAWTQPFRDDTDSRGGGCQYQWKIECTT